MSEFVLIGAGGHAKAIVEAIRSAGSDIAAYSDPHAADWLNAPRLNSDEDVEKDTTIVIGVGGTEPDRLERRLALLDGFINRGHGADPVVHPSADVSPSATIEVGAIVLAGAVVQPDARVGRGAIVNTGAMLEHDSTLGPGSHLAPGAIVLGGCSIGACAMIGAGAIVLPGDTVPDGGFVPAGKRYKAAS
ncbi:MAG: hypothetical protein QF654_09270 [Alphaproteobacteria bacterium]|nr:hypothetical protein [Alphaproteobacteria bacterium]